MYGTIARLRVKPGMESKLLELSRAQDALGIPGYAFGHVYRLDAGGGAYAMAVGFESREAYARNADSPEQDARYRAFRELLEADPEWLDGEIVHSYPS